MDTNICANTHTLRQYRHGNDQILMKGYTQYTHSPCLTHVHGQSHKYTYKGQSGPRELEAHYHQYTCVQAEWTTTRKKQKKICAKEHSELCAATSPHITWSKWGK